MAALFDKHDVVDTMDSDEACAVGVAFDHRDAIAPILCSFSPRNAIDLRLETFDRTQPWAPMVCECDGHIFTDQSEAGRLASLAFHRSCLTTKRKSSTCSDAAQPQRSHWMGLLSDVDASAGGAFSLGIRSPTTPPRGCPYARNTSPTTARDGQPPRPAAAAPPQPLPEGVPPQPKRPPPPLPWAIHAEVHGNPQIPRSS